MKSLLIILLTSLSLSLYSQQKIELCSDSQTNFIYTTQSDVIGNFEWYLDNQVSTGLSLFVNWNNYGLGFHNIKVLQNSNGCPSDTVYFTVEVVECPYTTMWAPNCFTPDGDETNNIWVPVGYNYRDPHFTVFNRWGQIIFESYDLNYGWDGTYNGLKCSDGVYIYLLDWKDVNGRYYTTHGHITLIK
jgi:gliding motility-associated-like protein